MEIEIALAVVILIAMVVLATVDLAFAHISDVGLRRLASEAEDSQNRQRAQFLREILEYRLRFRLALSATIQVLLISTAVLITLIGSRVTESRTGLVVFALLVGLVVTVIFRQVVPRLIVQDNPDRKFLVLLPIVRPLYRLVRAVTAPISTRPKSKEMQKLEATIAPDAADDREDDGDEDFQALMEVGEAEGIIEEEERELIESMVEFSDTRAGEIMTPADRDLRRSGRHFDISAARDLMIEEKYSRLPVYRDNIDNIEGMIYVRDLLQAWTDSKEDDPIEEIVRDAYFVPETKTASELLKSMQVNHVQIAIVIDEYGGVAGIVTVEDILEEIVGEIEDEDTEEEEIIEIIEGEDGYLGCPWLDRDRQDRTAIRHRARGRRVSRPSPGMITSEAGYVPKIGETLRLRGLEVEILRADDEKGFACTFATAG